MVLKAWICLMLWLACCAGGVARADTLLIGAEDDWYPYSANIDGEPRGQAVDIVRAAYRATGNEVKLVSMPYARCMKLTLAGKLVGCFDTSWDKSLVADYLFHRQPMFLAKIVIFARKDSTEHNLTTRDLENHRVAVTNGYTYGDDFDLDRAIGKDVSMRDLDGLRKLIAGRVDYAVVFEKVANYLAERYPVELAGRIKPVGEVRTMELFVSFGKRHPDAQRAVELLDRGLETIRRDGSYSRIEAAWR